jgi:hypothetical protein
MPKGMTHEQISQRFVEAKVFDFGAMGKLIQELGPGLSVSDQGVHGVVLGKYNTWACFIPALELSRIVDFRTAGLAAEAMQGSNREK